MINYSEFEQWLNGIIEEKFPVKGNAICFNLYEEENDYTWAVQMISAESYDEENDDWACNEVFSTGEDLFVFELEADWEDVAEEFCTTVKQYLEKGKNKDQLTQYDAIAAGFVDGDLETIYTKPHDQY